jgi:hypothetical protein
VPTDDWSKLPLLRRHLEIGNPRVAWRVMRKHSSTWRGQFPARFNVFFFKDSQVRYVAQCEGVCLTEEVPPRDIVEEHRDLHDWDHGTAFVLTSMRECDPMPTDQFVTWKNNEQLRRSPPTHTVVLDPL